MKSRAESILEGAAEYAAFYRANPHRFAIDYLHLRLKLFQCILLIMMNVSTVFVWIASRGLGKTFLCAVYCCVRCILYPGTKICIASSTRGQAVNILSKITNELKSKSKELAYEIDEKESKVNGTDAILKFKNGSYIQVVTSGESARGARANIVVVDEFRLVKKDVIDTIFKKFLTQKRMPDYDELTEQERQAEYAKECNMVMYLSSAYWADNWSFGKCIDSFKMMLSDGDRAVDRQFVCGIPYQLGIMEGIINKDQIESEVTESDFSEIKFSMEYEALFYGASEDSFFNYESISKNRHIKYPMYPIEQASKLGNNPLVRIQPKQAGEVRILSADIALMASTKHNNDATAIFINSMVMTKAGKYVSNIVYTVNYEGLRTDVQALIIRKLFDEFECDYIVLDCGGAGLGIYDALVCDITDADTGEIYPALSCCNDKDMASRCGSADAPKVIWSVKASAVFNSKCAVLLREGFKNGRIRLLENEYDGDESLAEIKQYASLSPIERAQLQLPYINTTLLIDELTKLQHEESNGVIKVYERSGMRKDRYSSLAYNYYIALQIESTLTKRAARSSSYDDWFVIRAPKSKTNGGCASGKKERYRAW